MSQSAQVSLLAQQEAQVLALLQAGDFHGVQQLAQTSISQGVESATLWFYLGASFDAAGSPHEAVNAFDKVLALAPQAANVWTAKSAVLSKCGRYEEALTAAQQALQLEPQSAAYHANLGVAYQQLAEFNKDHAAYEKAQSAYHQALNINPREATALINIGVMSLKQELFTLARQQCEAAHKALPTNTEILNNLIEACLQCFDDKAASHYCLLALKLEPNRALFYYKLALADATLGREEMALHALQKLAAISPEECKRLASDDEDMIQTHLKYVPALIKYNRLASQHEYGFWANRNTYLAHLEHFLNDLPATLPLGWIGKVMMNMLSTPLSGKSRRQIAERVCAVIPPHSPLSTGVVAQKEKIRIGYLSPDFRYHAVGHLTHGFFAQHDASQFETYAYSLVRSPDARTEEFKNEFAHFYEVADMKSEQIAQKIKEDGIDILVDLAWFTTDTRPEVMAMRPAPLQVAYLGYPGTSGAHFMDYAIVDNVTAPKEADDVWTEQLVRLPHAYYPYDIAIDNKHKPRARIEYGLSPEAVVLCAFHRTNKIEPEVFGCWMRIMQAVPQSVLWLLVSKSMTKEYFIKAATAYDIAPERLIFAPYIGYLEHVQRHDAADIFLDAFWYNGHTTALDALWQGLPVITCLGEAPSSRIAASFLTALEMPELIAQDTQEYEQKIIHYATDHAARLALRDKLINKRQSSPLFNVALTMRHIEEAYRQIWQRYQAGLPPATIDVPDLSK